MIYPNPQMYQDWREWARTLITTLGRQGDTGLAIAAVQDNITYAAQDMVVTDGSTPSTLVNLPVNAKDVTVRDYYEALIWGVVTSGGGGGGTITFALKVDDAGTDLGTGAITLGVPSGSNLPFFIHLMVRSVAQSGRLEFRGVGWGAIQPGGGGPASSGIAVSVAPFNFATHDARLLLTGAGSVCDVRFATVRKSRGRE